MRPSAVSLIFLIILLCSPAPAEAEDGRFFWGVSSGLYLSKNRAITLALRDAARRVSFFHSVEVRLNSRETYNPQLRISRMVYQEDLIHDTDYEKYLRLLDFDAGKDVYEENGALFVRARYTGEIQEFTDYQRGALPSAGRPGSRSQPPWIEKPPAEIGGFPCAVGFGGKRLSYKDTVIASYEDAVFALVKNRFYTEAASQAVVGGTMLESAAAGVSGTVKGFRVLETWRDGKSGAVWTLAAAREVLYRGGE
jgi:hypothetical protein